MNHKVRRKDKQFSSSSTTVEAMTARGMGSNHRKGKKKFEKSKIGVQKDLKKNKCAFCREGHSNIDCPKFKPKKESKSKANIAQVYGNNSDYLVIHFLSPLLVTIKRNLIEFWIRVLSITFVPNGSDLLVKN